MTARTLELLDVLARRVRLLTLRQLAELLSDVSKTTPSPRDVRRWVQRLSGQGLIQVVSLIARLPAPSELPVIVWSPGESKPDFGRAAYRLQRRWKQPPRDLTCVAATARTHHLYGTRSKGLTHPLQASHDLGLSGVYLHFRTLAPGFARAWFGEDALPITARRGARRPDAALCGPDGRLLLAVEFGGAYPPDRLRSFHAACARSDTPYQVW